MSTEIRGSKIGEARLHLHAEIDTLSAALATGGWYLDGESIDAPLFTLAGEGVYLRAILDFKRGDEMLTIRSAHPTNALHEILALLPPKE